VVPPLYLKTDEDRRRAAAGGARRADRLSHRATQSDSA
jgi:hypothetical protein